jgi:hypothetical protein
MAGEAKLDKGVNEDRNYKSCYFIVLNRCKEPVKAQFVSNSQHNCYEDIGQSVRVETIFV